MPGSDTSSFTQVHSNSTSAFRNHVQRKHTRKPNLTTNEGNEEEQLCKRLDSDGTEKQVFSPRISGSLLDAEEESSVCSTESVIITDEKVSANVTPLAKDAVRNNAAFRISCDSPAPSRAESTSESSSSSQGSNLEKKNNVDSIFRENVTSDSSGGLEGQISGTNSILSPSTARSVSGAIDTPDQNDDQGLSVPFTPLHRIPYVHGSYSTAAPIMLNDSKWMRILRHLMPESHADALTILCQERKASTSLFPNAVRIMKWAENNPVVAAYGMFTSDGGHAARRSRSHEVEYRSPNSSTQSRRSSSSSRSTTRRRPMMEWDVFLDPNLVQQVKDALEAADEIRRDDDVHEGAEIAAEVEVDRQVGRLISRIVLAHGSTSQLVAEAVGFSRRHNFASVVEQGESQRLHRRRRKSVEKTPPKSRGIVDVWKAAKGQGLTLPFGKDLVAPVAPGKGSAKAAGIFCERWLAIFATALQLAHGDGRIEPPSPLDECGKLIEPPSPLDECEEVEIRQVKPRMCGVLLCLGIEDPNSARADHSKTSMAKSSAVINEVLGEPLQVILDLKSRRVPPRVWARVVDTLRSRGIEVGGLGSFDIEELRSIGSYCLSPVTSAIFLHSAGDLQRACHANEVKRGDTVYFNAGSLIMPKPSIVTKLNCCQSDHYVSDGADEQEDAVVFQPYAYPRGKIPKIFDVVSCKSTIQDYQRRFNLRIGVYVQEFSICDRTLDAIAKFVNDNPSTYNLGLAWGGLNGRTSPGVPGDGYWNQRYIGRSWDLNAKPADAMHLLHIEDHHLVKKAFRAGAWGHIGTVNPVNDVGGDATGDGANLNFEACRPIE